MAVFVRKNALVFTTTFTASDGSASQPSDAYVVLRFKNTSGATTQVSIPLTYNATPNTWTGVWDSSAAQQGNVEWLTYGAGSLEAAAQGQFQIAANSANNV